MPDRLINETETVLLVPAYEVLGVPNAIIPDGLTPFDALTTTVLNYYASVNSPGSTNAGAGGNVSCAIITNGFDLGLGDSKTDNDLTLCDPGNAVDLTDLTFTAKMTGFRDANRADTTSQFNLWDYLTFAPDVPYLIVHRIGYASDVAFAVGHEIDVYYVNTDNPVPENADGAKEKITETFISKSSTTIGYVLAA